MSERRPFRAGDVVVQDGDVVVQDGRNWVVDLDEVATGDLVVTRAFDEGRRLVFGQTMARQFKLVSAATDAERLTRLRTVVEDQPGFRRSFAQALLDAEPKPRRTLADVLGSPPNGWEAYSGPSVVKLKSKYAEVSLNWSGAGLEVFGLLVYGDGLSIDELARSHRAVADLLDLLAEVSDV